MYKKFIKAFLVFAFCVGVSSSYAGEIPYVRAQNNIQLNVFGDATIFSLSYERLFASQRKFFLGGKLGLGYSQSLGLPVEGTALFAAPLHLTANYGEKSHYFEFGIGSTLLFYKDMKFWDYALYPIIGYRLQPKKNNKFCCRLYACYPLTDKLDRHNYWFFPVGISIGFNIKKSRH